MYVCVCVCTFWRCERCCICSAALWRIFQAIECRKVRAYGVWNSAQKIRQVFSHMHVRTRIYDQKKRLESAPASTPTRPNPYSFLYKCSSVSCVGMEADGRPVSLHLWNIYVCPHLVSSQTLLLLCCFHPLSLSSFAVLLRFLIPLPSPPSHPSLYHSTFLPLLQFQSFFFFFLREKKNTKKPQILLISLHTLQHPICITAFISQFYRRYLTSYGDHLTTFLQVSGLI